MQEEERPENESTRPGRRAGVLEQLAALGEDDDADVRVAEHGELVGLLEQALAALGEGHLPAHPVLDLLHLHPPTPHCSRAA